jgi:uncharacterized protein (DUF302 family)
MFKNKIFALALMALITGSLVSSAVAQTGGLVTVQSKSSFDKTVDQLKELVAKNGMMVLSELNQGKVMEMAGLKLNAKSLFVGSPTVGKKLFAINHGVGVAVPVRVNVYEDSDGITYVNYVKPSDQLAPFKNDEITNTSKMLDEKLGMLTGMLSK